MSNLKDYRDKELRSFHFLLIMLFFITDLGPDVISQLNEYFEESLTYIILKLLYSFSVPVMITIFENIISDNLKNKLLILPRYGEVIFSELETKKVNDDRIDINKALDKYETIIMRAHWAMNPKERRKTENKAWYEIYKKYDGNRPAVDSTQRNYLLCRDMYITSLFAFAIYIAFSVYYHFFKKMNLFNWAYCLILVTAIIVTFGMTQLRMRRFVCTVIAEDLANHL